MFRTYQEIYNTRGGLYHRAMEECPAARAREFELLVATANLRRDQVCILDIPSGGGYLRTYLPNHVRLVSADPADRFLHAGNHPHEDGIVCAQHDDLPFGDGTFDAVLSLAGMHHLDDHAAVFREWHRILKPGGTLAVADAVKGSPTSRYLDGVVHQFNTMGHHGNYFDEDVCNHLRGCGFTAVTGQEHTYTWDFADTAEMLQFCRTLFGLDRNPSDADLLAGINDTVGYHTDDRGAHLNWSLMFIRATA